MDESLDIIQDDVQEDLSPKYISKKIQHNAVETYKIYVKKPNPMYWSSIHKPSLKAYLYINVNDKDLIGNPILSSCKKSKYSWWDCRLFNKSLKN